MLRWRSLKESLIMFSKFLLMLLLVFFCNACSSGEKSFREKLKERLAIKMDKKMEEKYKSSELSFVINVNGVERKYLLHVPPKYDSKKPTPLLFAFHGGGGFMEHMAAEKNYKQISKSDENGHIVVFPNGYSQLPTGKFATWNAGKCCGEARDKKSDDVAFVKAMLLKIKSEYNIDDKKIYSTGMSNGGLFSYRLACEMSDVFSGIAAVAGTDNTIDCNPTKPISILHIHAQNDDRVLFNGGAGFEKNKEQVTEFISVKDSVSKWVKFNQCQTTPERVLSIQGAYCDEYKSCKAGVKVKLCVTETGKHSWPGGEKERGDEPPSKALSANDLMWEFFNQ